MTRRTTKRRNAESTRAANGAVQNKELRLQAELEAARQELATKNQRLNEMQRELGDLVDEYFDVYDSAPVAYLLLSELGIIQQLNFAACSLLGADRSRLLERPLITNICAEDRAAFLGHLRRCRSSDEPVDIQLQLRVRSGALVPVQLSSRRRTNEGSCVFRTVLVDLRERVRLEAERRKAEQDEQRQRASNEAKDRFLAMLSHELRTPLTPALFAAMHLLELPELPRDARHLAEVIRRSIEMEAELIDHLLDLTRIRTGKLVLEKEPLDLETVIREAVDICEAQLASRGQHLALALRARNREMLGDPARLRQVFWNLIQNASKFSPGSSRVDVVAEDAGEGRVRITVEDQGAGLSHEEAAHLFAPFETAPRMKRGSGLGLGLSICRGIVEGHGGSISGTSAGPDQGAIFAVELAAHQLTAPTGIEPARAPQIPSAADPGSMRILLVEDDQDSGDMLAELLAHLGHSVTVARTIAQASTLIGDPWDVVISDIGLPDGSGLDVGRRFRATGSQPVLIAMSGYGAPSDIAGSRQAGFDEHLVKPVDFNQLLMALRRPALN